MRIQHNISALNASNKLKSNDNAISKNIAKLSSGYRINSAADDAAGLAVSEKMRAQINGLTQAESNTENGISLVQTAEGGLNETQSILQRMNTLAVESSNGTYQDATDRANLNKEITALKSEVDRISTSTNFNQINLLDGSLGATGTAAAATVQLANNVKGGAYGFVDSTAATFASGAAVTAFTANTATVGDTSTVTVKFTDGNGKEFTKTVTLELTAASDGTSTTGTVKVQGTTLSKTGATNANPTAGDMSQLVADALNADSDVKNSFTVSKNGSDQLVFTANTKGTDGAKITGMSEWENIKGASTQTAQAITPTYGTDAYETTNVTGLNAYNGSNLSDAVFTVNGESFVIAGDTTDVSSLDKSVHVITVAAAHISGGKLTGVNGKADASKVSQAINTATGLSTTADAANGLVMYKTAASAPSTNGISFQIGSDNKADQRVSLSIGNMSAKGLGIQSVSIGTQQDALKAIDTIKTALNTVSATRADLGALQNRLEHTSNNLSTMNENLTSAESNIRDVDMSDEYVQYSKNQILSQAATSMLAQANSAPQNVLTLLKG